MKWFTGKPEPDPEPIEDRPDWTVRYTAFMDDGSTHSWDETWDLPGENRDEKAGNLLLSRKYGSYSQVFDGKLYPAHRLQEVTWELLDGSA